MSVYHKRRYLVDFDTDFLPHILTDCLIIGSGVAGLRAGIEAGNFGKVFIVTKSDVYESNTAYAQGGVAAVLKVHREDNIDLHIADTLRVGCGLNDVEVVKRVITEGPECIEELMRWGAKFDSKAGGELDLGREAGHSVSRILHAAGDATGKEIVRTLLAKISEFDNVQISEHTYTVDLLAEDGKCVGALCWNDRIGLHIIYAKQVIVATGGCGRIYQETTNPQVATADGIGLAWRIGAELVDMEMVQFHPTTLYVAGASRFLISEAVRGAGGILVDRKGYRFMKEYHPDAELAPRDVVSRAIMDYLSKTGQRYVYLDVRKIKDFEKHFPTITDKCRSFGIDVGKDLIPVRPSAHYMVGGIKVDIEGRTSVENLYACGECACTGLHGANRLASNSLLEGIVFGKIAGRCAGEFIAGYPGPERLVKVVNKEDISPLPSDFDIQDIRTSLRTIMWRHVGIKRKKSGLEEAIFAIDRWGGYVLDKRFTRPIGWETQNMLTCAFLVAKAALERTESRGVHFREDYPQTDDENWKRHIVVKRDEHFV